MTGYAIKKILPDEIILSQPKISLVISILAGIGILFLILSVLTKFKIINPPDITFNIFTGMGIIFTAGSILFMIQKIPDSITFSKTNTSVIFSENSETYSIPFADFSRFHITGQLSGSGSGISSRFQLDLVYKNGSSFTLCESEQISELQQTAETLASYIDIDIISGADILHQGKDSYRNIEPVFPDKSIMSIKSEVKGDSLIYKWHSRKSLISIFLLGSVIFGFNFLFFTWAFPVMSGFNIGIYIGGFILVLIDIMFTWIIIFNSFGSNNVEISDTSFSYRQKLFGYSLNSRTFKNSDIAMISSGFTADNNRITLFTKRGLDIYNELRISAAMISMSNNSLNDKSAIMTLFPKIMEFRSNIIEIDGNPLYYYEKLYLENKWHEKLNLRNVQGSM